MTRPSSAGNALAGPTSWISTQISQATVPYSGKASSCLNQVIQAPGRGNRLANPGTAVASTIGAASPMPSATNTASASGAGATSAKPSAAPMNGAVQGVATIVARMP